MRRVILCSSINAVNGYPRERQVRASDVAFPGNIYGATKAFSEALAGAFVSLHPGFSAIAVRIGGCATRTRCGPARLRADRGHRAPGDEPGRRPLGGGDASGPLPPLRLLPRRRAGGGVRRGQRQLRNRHLRMDLEETRRLVGYEPQDDAFADWSPPPLP